MLTRINAPTLESIPTTPAPSVPPLDPAKVTALIAIQQPRVLEICSVGWYGGQYWAHYSDAEWHRTYSALATYNLSPVQARFEKTKWLAEINRTSDLSDDLVELIFNDYDWNVTSLWWGYGGEGVPVIITQYFPDVDLLVEIFDGYMRTPKESDGLTFPVQVSNGFRSPNLQIPRRVIYPGCAAIFGGLINPTTGNPWFPTQAQIDANDCPYNRHIGGSVGKLNGGVPFTDCPRQRPSDCSTRLYNPTGPGDALSYLGFDVISGSEVVGSGGSHPFVATVHANESALKQPIRVVYGFQRVQDLILLGYEPQSSDSGGSDPNNGFLVTLWVICEGPIVGALLPNGRVLGIENQNNPEGDGNPGPSTKGLDSGMRVNDMPITCDHINWSGLWGVHRQAWAKVGQAGLPNQLNYSGTSVVNASYGRSDFRTFGPDSLRASIRIVGKKDIRQWATPTSTPTKGYTQNRAWCLLDLLTNKRYGLGLDVSRFVISEWIALAAWCNEGVPAFDETGAPTTITRSTFNGVVDGRTAQQTLGDFCMMGRMTPPFQHQGKLHVLPLREDEVPAGVGTGPPATPITISNAGFETPVLAAGGYLYTPSGAGWVFGSASGVARNGSPFVNTSPEGSQVGWIQNVSTLTQALSGFTVGASYFVKFKTAKRPGYGSQWFDVYMDALLIGTATPSSETTFDQISFTFTATATSHTLKFQGRGSQDGAIDDVQIVPTSTSAGWTGPTFADYDNDMVTGADRNIIFENGRSTLTYSIKADDQIPNEIKFTFNDANYDDQERPLVFQDLNAQLLAGRASGDLSFRVVNKTYAGMGINGLGEAGRMGTMLLYFGQNDEGGLKNNFTIKFKTWSILGKLLQLHPYQVIRVCSQRVNRFTERGTLEWEPYAADAYQWFRIMKLTRQSGLVLEITAQLYARSALQAFVAPTPPSEGGAIPPAPGDPNPAGPETTGPGDSPKPHKPDGPLPDTSAAGIQLKVQ